MATVTNAEYQNAKNAVNDKYTAESIQNYSNAYKGYMAQWMSSDDALAKAKWLLVENTPSKTQTTTQTTIENNKPTTPVQGTTQNQWENQGTTVTEVKQEWALKPLSQDYYNQTSSNALDVIKNNLNSYKQSNPEYFNNYEDYKKNVDVSILKEPYILDFLGLKLNFKEKVLVWIHIINMIFD